MTESDNDRDHTRAFFIPTAGVHLGHYELLQRLGSGGMGDVFLAQDNSLNRRVAIKFLSQQLSSDPDAKARFLREAQAAAALNHPNVVTIYEVSEHESRPYIVMENVDGQSLKEVLKQDLPLNKIIDIGVQLCDGLQKAHQLGIVHRDIKPANIIVDTDGRPRLLDFGLATVQGASQITRAGSTLGTIAYMSPEQAQGQTVDHRSDIYSLGIVLYEMIARKQPFGRDTDAATLGAIIYDTPAPLAQYRPDVPPGLQAVLDRALDKDLETRYQSASGLMADLKREKKLLDGTQSSPSSPSIRALPAKKRSRMPLVVSTSGALLVLLLILLLKPWNLSFSTDQQAQASEQWMAIMYFDNLTDPADEQRLGEIVTNLLITDLSEAKSIRVVSSQRLYDILKELGKEGQRRVDREMSTQVARKAGAKWMLTGSILQVEPEIIMTSQLIDVASGGVLASHRLDGEAGEKVFAVTEKLARKLRVDPAFPREMHTEPNIELAAVSTSSPEAYRYYLEGIEYQQQFDHAGARNSFRRAVNLDSTFAIAWARLASQSDGEDWRRAKEAALRFIDHASPLEKLLIRAYGAQAEGDQVKASEVLAEAATKYPDNKEILYQLASAQGNMGDTRAAIVTLHKVLALDRMFKTGWNQLAYNYMRLGDLDSALISVNRYLELAPDEPNPYDSKGDMLASMGLLDSAASYYEKALQIKPDFTMRTITKLSILKMIAGDYGKAESLVKQAMSSPEAFERTAARSQWVYLFLYRGQFKKALEELEVVSKADLLERGEGPSLEFQIIKARIYHYLGDVQRAWREFGRFATYIDTLRPTVPRSGRAPLTRTLLAMSVGETKVAEEFLDSMAVDAAKDSAETAAYRRARAYYFMLKPNLEKSLADFQYVAQQRVNFSASYELGRAYLLLGRFQEAVDALEAVRNSFFDEVRFSAYIHNVLYYYYLGRAYEGLGKTDQAIKDYSTFVEIWKDADSPIDDLKDAQKRLAALKARV